MLEVLDPEQNSTFRDHYLDLPFDLSKVLFICTANQLETIPPPLLDRMDVIQLSGYTEDEKLAIARKYLVPKQLEEHGLDARRRLTFTDERARAGDPRVHARGRACGTSSGRSPRSAARPRAQIAEGKTRSAIAHRRAARARVARAAALPGRGAQAHRRPRRRDRPRRHAPSAATSSSSRRPRIPGKGRLQVTGQLGEVMQESAQAALSWVRVARRASSGSTRSGSPSTTSTSTSPPARCPKDGPSAGVTMATAIVSLVTRRAVSEDVGMTGEITLTGQVLPIGGVREKVLAAQRAGLETVILPRENEPDLEDLPEETREQLEFILADTIEEVLAPAFDGAGGRGAGRPSPRSARQRRRV